MKLVLAILLIGSVTASVDSKQESEAQEIGINTENKFNMLDTQSMKMEEKDYNDLPQNIIEGIEKLFDVHRKDDYITIKAKTGVTSGDVKKLLLIVHTDKYPNNDDVFKNRIREVFRLIISNYNKLKKQAKKQDAALGGVKPMFDQAEKQAERADAKKEQTKEQDAALGGVKPMFDQAEKQAERADTKKEQTKEQDSALEGVNPMFDQAEKQAADTKKEQTDALAISDQVVDNNKNDQSVVTELPLKPQPDQNQIILANELKEVKRKCREAITSDEKVAAEEACKAYKAKIKS